MSVVLQMADCLVGWKNCDGGMPDGNLGQENQQGIFSGQNRLWEAASSSASLRPHPSRSTSSWTKQFRKSQGRCSDTCGKIHEARLQVDPGPHGEGPILFVQQCGRPDHSRLLPIFGGPGKMHCPWCRPYPREARKAAGNRCQHSFDFYARLQQRHPTPVGRYKGSHGCTSCTSFYTPTICCSCCGLAESEGGTHADVIWLVWLNDACGSRVSPRLFLRPRRFREEAVEGTIQ